jgi:ABC-type multidrug transport system permease subunit
MKSVAFIALHDARHQLRQGSTLLWVLVLPAVFFYFIGTVTSSFSGTMTGASATPIVIAAQNAGFLRDQVDRRLRDNSFAPEWREEVLPDAEGNLPRRVLTFDDNLSDRIAAGDNVTASFDTRASALSRQYEIIRIQRSLYTSLADIVTADARAGGALSASALVELNNATRVWQLDVAAAGQRQEIPSGFDQAIPGMLVMFTLLVLLTSGGSMLVFEREQGLLRRLAYAPISRAEVVVGKWGGRMLLAILQIASAALIGTLLFDMHWGPDVPMIIAVLFAWAAFCASAGLLLGSVAKTDGQASGLGVLVANVLAALGGCWWPIEVTPPWMQGLQNFLPTGWAMDALHQLISFEAGAASALPYVLMLLLGAAVVTGAAVRAFRYE